MTILRKIDPNLELYRDYSDLYNSFNSSPSITFPQSESPETASARGDPSKYIDYLNARINYDLEQSRQDLEKTVLGCATSIANNYINRISSELSSVEISQSEKESGFFWKVHEKKISIQFKK